MSGCGGNCACAKEENIPASTCAVGDATEVLNSEDKCACGKTSDKCCKNNVDKSDNDALGELCASHGGKDVC